MFTAQSGRLAAARKPEWLEGNPERPVDLTDEDPEVFQGYMNCVYFGSDIVQYWVNDKLSSQPRGSASAEEMQQFHDTIFTKFIELYVLAQKMIDFQTANMVIDEIIRFRETAKVVPVPMQAAISLAYKFTVKNDPLRRLLRDCWVCDPRKTDREVLLADDFPVECLQDIAVASLTSIDEYLSRRWQLHPFTSIRELCGADKCHYHRQDKTLAPKCAPLLPETEDTGV